MEIDVNLPYLSNGSSPEPVDESILVALTSTVQKMAAKCLRSRPRVKPYHLGPTYGRIVTFDFKPFSVGSNALDDAIALNAMLEGLIEANIVYMRNKRFPSLFDTSVRYDRTKVWDSILGLIQRGYGDCKSLTAVRVAELRMMGYNAIPQFRWKRRDNGGKDFHILIDSELGYEDPSRLLGMGMDENAWFRH